MKQVQETNMIFSAQLVIKVWHGPKVKGQIRDANRRLVGSIAYDAQEEARSLADVLSGRMRGATTVEPPGTNFTVDKHAPPQDYSKDREGAIAQVAVHGDEVSVEVGSYVPYAFIEEVLRGHRFIQPAMDNARANIATRVAQAGREVGLQ